MTIAFQENGSAQDANAVLMEVRPAPWRVLRLYIALALTLTLGPVLIGLWSGVVGYLLTQCTVREILERCVDLVGLAPFMGTAIVLVAIPAGWMILAETRHQSWQVRPDGISVLDRAVVRRRMAWSEIDTIRAGANGPLIILKDRSQEGEQMLFVPRSVTERLLKVWTERTECDVA